MNPLELLAKSGTPMERNKGEVILGQGDKNQSLYLVRVGLLKAVYVLSDGKEFVKSFLKEGDIIGSLSSCVLGESSTFTLICLENVKLVKIPFSELSRLAGVNAEAAHFVIEFLLKLALMKERREYEFLCLSAEERYQLLRSRDPELLNRITQNDIARYLGITPVALSRIRKRLCAGPAS